MDFLNLRFPFILAVIIFWTCYVLYRHYRNPGVTNHWGFRTDNFLKVVQIVLPFGILSLASFICIGLYQHTINITWHIIPILILYPVWGIIQQFLLIALIAGNLYDFKNLRFAKGTTIFLSAVLFGLIHYPYVWLMIGTFALATFYSVIYLKQRNIYVLGIFHGWLACFFFYTVVNRDPFVETLGRLLKVTK